MDTPIWPILATAIVGFTAWSENGSQNCVGQCNNKPAAILDVDDSIQIVDKILKAVNNQHKLVHWRRVVMISLIIAVITAIILSLGPNLIPIMPTGIQILIMSIILFIVLYFCSVSISTYWWQYIDDNITEALMIYRHRLVADKKNKLKV